MKKNAPVYRRHSMTPMHVGKLTFQLVLERQMYGRRGSMLLQLTGADIMVDRQNFKNAK